MKRSVGWRFFIKCLGLIRLFISSFWDNFGEEEGLWSSNLTICVISSKISGWFWWVETTGGLQKGWDAHLNLLFISFDQYHQRHHQCVGWVIVEENIDEDALEDDEGGSEVSWVVGGGGEFGLELG